MLLTERFEREHNQYIVLIVETRVVFGLFFPFKLSYRISCDRCSVLSERPTESSSLTVNVDDGLNDPHSV